MRRTSPLGAGCRALLCGIPLLAPAAATAAPELAPPAADACALVERAAVERIQQSVPADLQPSLRSSGGLQVAGCFVRTEDYARSVSLVLTAPDAGAPGAAVARWRALFHGEPRADRELEEEPVAVEIERAPASRPIGGVGREAFWIGTAGYGALYVLADERYFRISVGGPGDAAAKLERARALALVVLSRLSTRS